MNDSELLTVSQAAEACNATNQTIRNWIKNGRLHGVRIGNRFLIAREEVDRLRGDVRAPGGRARGITARRGRLVRFRERRTNVCPMPTRPKVCWGSDRWTPSRRSTMRVRRGARLCASTSSRHPTPRSARDYTASPPRLPGALRRARPRTGTGSSGPRPGAAPSRRTSCSPGTGRRGPEELWERFDEAVAELDRVSEGRSMRAVGRAYAELAEIASQLAKAVEREDRASGLLPRAATKRRRSA